MSELNVLVACEFSAIVRDAFIARGHNAWSCDLLPTEGRAGNHLQGDIRWALEGQLHKFPNAVNIRTGRQPLFIKWDLLIAHPPCTRLTNAGVRWLYYPPTKLEADHYSQQQIAAYAAMTVEQRLAFMWAELETGTQLFSELLNANIPHICIENPIMHYHAKNRILNYQPPSQTIQPYEFGHGETKAVSLYLKQLPLLKPTNYVEGREARVHRASPGPQRWKQRSRFFTGIADAMAVQWGKIWV